MKIHFGDRSMGPVCGANRGKLTHDWALVNCKRCLKNWRLKLTAPKGGKALITALSLIMILLTACGTDESAEKPATESVSLAPDNASVGARGEKGERGEQGPKGDKGDRGDKGADGKNGKNGKPTTANQWFDPINGYYWLIGGAVSVNERACGGDYIVPTMDQLRDAQRHGLFIVANVSSAWSSETYRAASDMEIDQALCINANGSDCSQAFTSAERRSLFCVSKQPFTE